MSPLSLTVEVVEAFFLKCFLIVASLVIKIYFSSQVNFIFYSAVETRGTTSNPASWEKRSSRVL